LKLTIKDPYGDYSEPFVAAKLTDKTACRFCQTAAEKGKNLYGMTAAGKKKLAESYTMAKGEKAIRLIVNRSSTGTAYVCMKCAKALLENLQRELG